MKITNLFVLRMFAGSMFSVWTVNVPAQTVLEAQEAAKVVAVRKVAATPSLVTGEIVNRTPHLIRDVELLVQYHWRWKNEFKPGKDAPGRTDVVKIGAEIKPGDAVAFRYSPNPPLPDRKDGWFEPEVTVGGFTTVVPQV